MKSNNIKQGAQWMRTATLDEYGVPTKSGVPIKKSPLQFSKKYTVGDKLQKIFSIKGLIPKPLFKQAPACLRFEISEESYDDTIGMMLRVMEKSEALFNEVFKNSKSIWIILQFYSAVKLKPNKLPNGFQDLIGDCQYKINPTDIYQVKEHRRTKDEGVGYFYFYAIQKKPDFNLIKPIIWAAGGFDIGIHPRAEVQAFFIDFEKEIIFHLYDDRGLDIVSNKKEALQECYKKYSKWILEHNRKEIDEIFGQ